jgi:hypothetical protein
MNRIENTINFKNQTSSSAFSPVNGRTTNSSMATVLLKFFKSIDWKTIAIGVLWPFIIRLVFYLFRKFKDSL